MSTYGFNIRRLVSKKAERSSVDVVRERESSGDEGGFQGPSSDSRDARKESWFSAGRKQGRSWPSTSKFSFRPRSLPYNISSILLPLSSETSASSSASSLCSCDRHESPSLAGNSRSTLCSLASRDESRSELSLRASSATSYDGNTSSSPLSEDNDTDSTPTQSRLDSSRPKLDRVKSMPSSTTEDKDRDTSRHSCELDATDDGVRHSVEEFILEANKAFKIGNSFREVNATRTSFNETPRLPPTDADSLPRRRASVQRKPKKVYRFSRTQAAPISPANSVQRKASVKTVKRKKSTKARPMKSHRKSLGPKPANKNNSKWTENMTDLLSGKLFQKIEADEMLTPAQLEAYKLRRLSKLQLAAATAAASETSLASEVVEAVDTPVEPFHMEDLPTRIGSSGVKLTAGTPIEDKPDPAVLKGILSNTVVSDSSDELFLGQSSTSTSSDVSAKVVASQHSQTTSPCRYIFRKIPELPTISENNTFRDELFLSHGTAKLRSNSINTNNTNPDYVFLRSTPYTMTAPRFRHGPIRLAKADLCPEPRIGGEDGLDWTAFQMAILGGAGDFYFTDSEHMARQHEADDAEAICAWWDGWDLADGYGRLVTQDSRGSLFPSSVRRRSEQSSSSSSSSSSESSNTSSEDHAKMLYDDIGRDNPYSGKHRWRSLRRKAVLEGRSLDLDVAKNNTNKSAKGGRKSSNNHHRGANKKSGNKLLDTRESMVSMPQSPMLDLRVVTSDSGDVDIVPMGYNLSHDLGDFLSWENENVHMANAMYDGNFI
ncbi:hypothetical protein BJ166DRAFT_216091 [Pestalotiopsis sp. NC0098]|nr:hypothetical protein BJ166DRAFT_216091 [Pestalotiopsis sp. NC0098]